MAFEPFKSEDLGLEIAGLTVDGDRATVAFHGSVRITRDRAGLAVAKDLHALLGQIVATLEAEDLPETLPREDSGSVDNPFFQR